MADRRTTKKIAKKIATVAPAFGALGLAVLEASVATDKPLWVRLAGSLLIAAVSVEAVEKIIKTWRHPKLLWSIYGFVIGSLVAVVIWQFFHQPKPGKFLVDLTDDDYRGITITNNLAPLVRIGSSNTYVYSNCIVIPVDLDATNFNLHMGVYADGAPAHTVEATLMVSTNATVTVNSRSIPNAEGVEGSNWRVRFGGSVRVNGQDVNLWQSRIPEISSGYYADLPPISISLKPYPKGNVTLVAFDLEANNFPRQTTVAALVFMPAPPKSKPKKMYYARLGYKEDRTFDMVGEFTNESDRYDFYHAQAIIDQADNHPHLSFKASSPHSTNSLWLTNESFLNTTQSPEVVFSKSPLLLLPNSKSNAVLNLEFFTDRPLQTRNVEVQILATPGFDRSGFTNWTILDSSPDFMRLQYQVPFGKTWNSLPPVLISSKDMAEKFRNVSIIVSGYGFETYAIDFTLLLPDEHWRSIKAANWSDFTITRNTDMSTNGSVPLMKIIH